MTIEDRLTELGLELPPAAAPAASYLPAVAHAEILYLSGQLPFAVDGSHPTGRVGAGVDLAGGQAAARLCALNILARLKAEGVLERVERIVKLGVFVASAPDFTDQHKVANGASDLLAQVFGECGRHARAAVGVMALPLDAPVEIDAVIALRPE